MKRPTNRRMVVGLLGALLLVLWGFIGYWSWSQHRKILESGTVLLEQLTSAVEEQTLRLFKQAETSLTITRMWMVNHPGEDPGTTASFIGLADRLRQLSGGLLDIRLVSRDGGLFYVPKKGPAPLADVSDRDYFKAQQNTTSRGFYIGNPVISRVTGKWGIPVSMPVDSAGGDVGVVFVAMELDRIAKTFEAERPKPDGAISIMRADGTFLFRVPAGSNIIGQSIAGTPSWDKHISQAERGTYYSDGSAVGTPPKLVSFIRLKEYPLYVTVAAEVDDLLIPWRRETLTLVAIAAAMTLLSVVVALFLLRAMKAEDLARQEIERAHRDARMILNSAGEGICGVDASGAISFINPAARKMLGLMDLDPVGRNFHHLSHHSLPDGAPYPGHDCPVAKTLTDGKLREVQHETFWHSNGRPVPVDLVVSPVFDNDTVSGAVVVFHDIAERIKAELKLARQAADLARSNADLEQFAYIASHDLREPLRQVASYVSLLERRYGAQLDQDAREFIAFARDGASRMNQLVIDLLDFSRVGHSATSPQQVPIRHAVDLACANLATRIAECDGSVACDESLPVVSAIEGDLVRLFQNLIGNAVKYRAPDRRPEITITSRRDGPVWIITVADNGIGIDPTFFDKIFGIFQRLHTRDKFDGTGIGLAICKKIVEGMGGRIWVDSQPGHGSRFHFTLPVVPA